MEDKSVAELIKSVLMKNAQISTFTWVNHYSCLLNISNKISISDFDFVGIDGQFLAYLMENKIITSAADRVLPLVLQDSVKVLFIGGTKLNSNKRLFRIRKLFPKVEVVGNYDGFTVDTMSPQFAKSIFEKSPNLIIIGTGSPSQEKLSTYLKKFGMDLELSGIAIVTCGGWLDQILIDSYYPSWSYKLKLNWIIRLIREPMRLWKRYSVYAIKAIFKKSIIRNYLDGVVS